MPGSSLPRELRGAYFQDLTRSYNFTDTSLVSHIWCHRDIFTASITDNTLQEHISRRIKSYYD
jgi:hypothetical protein